MLYKLYFTLCYYITLLACHNCQKRSDIGILFYVDLKAAGLSGNCCADSDVSPLCNTAERKPPNGPLFPTQSRKFLPKQLCGLSVYFLLSILRRMCSSGLALMSHSGFHSKTLGCEVVFFMKSFYFTPLQTGKMQVLIGFD